MTAYMLWNGSAIHVQDDRLDSAGLGSYPAVFEAFTIDLEKKNIPLAVFDLWLKEQRMVLVSALGLSEALKDCTQSFVEITDVKENPYTELVSQLHVNDMEDLFDWAAFEKRCVEEQIQNNDHYAIECDGRLYVFKKSEIDE